jgi:hypothetical protein
LGYDPLVAVLAADRIRNHGVGSGARRNSGRKQLGEGLGESQGIGVSVNGLEEVGPVVAHIARLDDRTATQLRRLRPVTKSAIEDAVWAIIPL